MHTSTDQTVRVRRNETRMAVSVLIPRKLGNKDEARATRDQCMKSLETVVHAALHAYGDKLIYVRKRSDGATLEELAHLKVSNGQRVDKDDRDMVLFFIPTPHKLVKGGRGSLSDALDAIARRVVSHVRQYWEQHISAVSV